MADHLRSQISDAAVDGLIHHPPYGASAFAARTWPLDDIDLPAVIVWTDGGPSRFDSQAEDDADIPLERDERLIVEGRVRTVGVDPDRSLDAIEVTVVQRLMHHSSAVRALVDRLEPVGVEKRSAVVGDAREGLIRLTFRIVYTTPAGDPTRRA